jgi:hypothetical protein
VPDWSKPAGQLRGGYVRGTLALDPLFLKIQDQPARLEQVGLVPGAGGIRCRGGGDLGPGPLRFLHEEPEIGLQKIQLPPEALDLKANFAPARVNASIEVPCMVFETRPRERAAPSGRKLLLDADLHHRHPVAIECQRIHRQVGDAKPQDRIRHLSRCHRLLADGFGLGHLRNATGIARECQFDGLLEGEWLRCSRR